MLRISAFACSLFAFVLLIHGATEGAQAQKAQMVKGTVKEVQLDKDVLIVNQKVKNEFVDRELSILSTTEFVLKIKGETKTGTGSSGFKLLDIPDAKGAAVQVKCDKDVNVLKVTVTIK
jgi:hypothetical protein